jgi:uncharacterized protein involved in exopolysaccharide biosynthesis/Mrp family chromosome partitioning ATPase
MNTRIPNGLTRRDIARILFRHRRKIALCFLSVVGLTLLAIAVYPRSYGSEAKIFLRVGRESVALDPTATTGETIMLQKSQVDEVNSALNILNSREVLQQVAERVGVERVLDDVPQRGAEQGAGKTLRSYVREGISGARAWLATVLDKLQLSDRGTELDLAIRRLEKGVRVWAPKQSTVISVSYYAASPQLAHDVVQAVTNVFLEEHLRLSRTEGSFAFFSEQAESLSKELVAAETELRDRKSQFQLVSGASRRAILESQIENVEIELLQTQRDQAFSEAKIADLKKAISGLTPELITNRVAGFANQARDGMREKLYELEIKESELRAAGYTDSYPVLAQLQQQRKAAEQILADLPNDRTQTTAALNPNQRQLELELLQAAAGNEAIGSRRKAAEAQHTKLYAELKTLNDQELQLDQLERNVDLLDEKYRMHVEKLEQARVNEELGRKQNTSNAKVAQQATLVSQPVWPNKRLLFALGLIAAIGGSLGWAFIAESLDQTLRTTHQVEAQVGLPVLVSLPLRKQRRRRATAGTSSNGQNGTAQNGHNGHSAQNGHTPPARYRALVSELMGGNGNGKDRHATTVGIVGCGTSKSRSRVAADLALQAANAGRDPVLLIDADSRRGRLARRFQVLGMPGWREVLTGAATAESCIQRPGESNLAVMSPGGANGHNAEQSPQNGKGVAGQLDEIRNEFGLVVVDLPPAGGMGAPPAAAEWFDEVVLVVEAEQTRIQAAQQAKAALDRAGVHVKGVVLANRREHIPRWLYRRL